MHASASADGVEPNGHALQTAEVEAFTAVEYRDEGHIMQADSDAAPASAEKRPAGQGSQRPVDEDEKRPGKQSMHRRAAKENCCPGLQLRRISTEQLDASAAPSAAVVKPESQERQKLELAAETVELYLPLGQELHAVACASRRAAPAKKAPKRPAGQGVQLL